MIGIGFISAFLAQVLIAPIADRGHARRLVVAGMLANVVGLMVMAAGDSCTFFLIAFLACLPTKVR